MGSERGQPPLVSIIVRTLGREEIRRTFACIAAQSYRPLEIVLVDSADRGLTMERFGDVPVRVVTGLGRLDRSRAANAGFEAARGDWVLILDEDDEISPAHVASLVATATVAGTRVAYSQARLVGPDGTQRLLGGPFSLEMLRRSNYLAIHAVLFHRDVLAAGCRFDTAIPVLEDWDFWLQAASHYDFAFSGQPTAIYHVSAGQSGGGGGSNLDREAVLAARNQIAAKWAAR